MQIRMPLILAFLFLMASCFIVAASELEDRFIFSAHTYIDNTNTKIYSGKFDLKKKLSKTYGMGFSIGVDSITGATQTVSQQQGGGNDEDEEGEGGGKARVYPSLRGIYDDHENTVVLGAYYSVESDYTGRSVFLNYTRMLNMDNTSLGIGLSQSFDTWEVSDLPENDRKERFVNLSFSQVLSRASQVQLIYSWYFGEGYLGSPVKEKDIGGTIVRERLPDVRTGHAFAAQLVTLLNEPTSLHLYYRYYFDDWDIDSHTVNLELYRDVTRYTTLGGRVRYYTQSEANFIRDPLTYTPADDVIVFDYKYSAFQSYTLGLIVLYQPHWESFRIMDWDNAKIKFSLDYYQTSDNDLIKYWFDEKNIYGVYSSLSLEYLF